MVGIGKEYLRNAVKRMGNAVAFIFLAHTWLYFSHRFLLHGIFWKEHSIHHAHVWLRMHWIEHTINWVTFPIGWLLGFSFLEMLPILVWGVAFTFLAHKRKWPRLSRAPKILLPFVMTVESHWEHHKQGSNYGVFITLWDKMLGTYVRTIT